MTGSRKRKFLLAAILLILGLLFGNGCANGVFYHPTRHMYPPPDQRGMTYQDVPFSASDGTGLTGWWLPAEGKAKGTVIHFHGNAQNMSTHVRFADWLPASGYNLFVFDYRGYGNSGGTPGREGLVLDGAAALQTVHQRKDVNPETLYVWGQSLGGTVALQSLLVADVPVRAAVIDSTFYSHVRIASDKMKQLPWFLQPLRLLQPILITGGYDANEAVKELDLPLLFIHGEKDRIIPYSHSVMLQKLVPETSSLWIVNDAGHCDAVLRFPEEVRPVLLRFFENPPEKISL